MTITNASVLKEAAINSAIEKIHSSIIELADNGYFSYTHPSEIPDDVITPFIEVGNIKVERSQSVHSFTTFSWLN